MPRVLTKNQKNQNEYIQNIILIKAIGADS